MRERVVLMAGAAESHEILFGDARGQRDYVMKLGLLQLAGAVQTFVLLFREDVLFLFVAELLPLRFEKVK